MSVLICELEIKQRSLVTPSSVKCARVLVAAALMTLVRQLKAFLLSFLRR